MLEFIGIYTPDYRSLNFKEMQWIEKDDQGNIIDPYKLLPGIFEGFDIDEIDLMINHDQLANGGAAMTAYAQMQFSDMTYIESEAISNALLKYCELDTLAMVMIFEFWANEVGIMKQHNAA